MELLEKDPNARPQSAAEVADQLAPMEDTASLLAPATSGPSPNKRRGLLAAGALILLLATVVFFFQTPHGTVRVEINDPNITVQLAGETITFENQDGKTITAKPGRQELTVTHGDFTFNTEQLTLGKGKNPPLQIAFHAGKLIARQGEKLLLEERVTDSETPPHRNAHAKTSRPSVENAGIAVDQLAGLYFDGESTRVSIDLPPHDPTDPLTFEALVTFASLPPIRNPFQQQTVVTVPGQAFHTLTLGSDGYIYGKSVPMGKHPTPITRAPSWKPIPIGRPVWLAVVWENMQPKLFLDGQEQMVPHTFTIDQKSRAAKTEWLIGSATIRHFLHGIVHEVRFSRSARYRKNYQPPARDQPLAADKDTLALYHFEDGAGAVLKDSSKNGHHGEIRDGVWLPSEEGYVPRPLSGLYFDGNSTSVRIPDVSLDNSHSLTIEALVTVYSAPEGRLPLMASFRGKAQVRLGLHEDGRVRGEGISAEDNELSVCLSARKVPLSQPVWLAVVWDRKQTRLFVNGQLQDGPNTYPKEMPFETLSGWRIGTAGGTSGGPSQFHGVLHELRVSHSARYQQDYAPPALEKPLAADEQTMALYHFDEGAGALLKDASGNGYHGKINEPILWMRKE